MGGTKKRRGTETQKQLTNCDLTITRSYRQQECNQMRFNKIPLVLSSIHVFSSYNQRHSLVRQLTVKPWRYAVFQYRITQENVTPLTIRRARLQTVSHGVPSLLSEQRQESYNTEKTQPNKVRDSSRNVFNIANTHLPSTSCTSQRVCCCCLLFVK